MTNTSTNEQGAAVGDHIAGGAKLGAEVADFVERYRDGYPQKVAASDGCMINTTYALADGDTATDEGWRTRSEMLGAPGIALPVEAAVAVAGIGRDYNGRGTEPDDGRAMTVRDDEPAIDGPRDPLFIMDGRDGRVFAGCVICEERGSANGTPGSTGTDDGSLVVAADPGSARSAMSGHLRREHDRSPWPGQR